jgi:hypothetical protein
MKFLFLIFTCVYTVLAQDTVKFCQPGFEICKNDGLCLVVDNQNVLCICTFGYGGRLYILYIIFILDLNLFRNIL